MSRTRALLVAPIALCVAAVGARQEPQRPPVFRAGTVLVPLTVTVIDKDGRPVSGLTQADFSVSENGRLRDIVTFFQQSMRAGEAAPLALSTATDRSPWSAQVAPGTGRTFLFVLGFGRIQYPTKAIDGLVDFIRTRALPQDAIAVLALNRATNFTTDHDSIIQLLERYKRDHERIVFNVKEFRVFNRLGLAQPASTQADIDAIFAGPPPGHPMRKAADILLGIDQSVPVPEQPGTLTANLGWERLPLSDLVTELNVLKLYAGVEYLRPLEGEKHLVFLGGEVEIVSAEEAAILARRASHAQVTLDIIRTTGTPSVFPVEKVFSERPNGGLFGMCELQQLQTAAGLTGGVFTGVSMADKALAQVDQRSRTSYLIGYEPVNTVLDGGFRNIVVKVRRPGVTVLFRHGYFAAERPGAADVNDAIALARVETALRFSANSTDIGLDIRARSTRTGQPMEVNVDVTINASRIGFTKTSEGRYAMSIAIGVYCANSARQLVGMVKGLLRGDVDEPTYRGYLEHGIPYSFNLPVAGDPYDLRIIASDAGSGLLGTASARVKQDKEPLS
ncbi:MAG TPA: VWA domain-containing protein [Vicinamibacterales bacterium]|nr:VWA domain-containing protein [Vicinamibacterales bacterium]